MRILLLMVVAFCVGCAVAAEMPSFDEGRFHQFRPLFHLGEVRKLMNPELY